MPKPTLSAPIPGGQNLRATGDWSFTATRYAEAAVSGAFARGDLTTNSVTANTDNQVSFQADGAPFVAIQGLADRLDEENDRLCETVNEQAEQIDVQTDYIDAGGKRTEALERKNEQPREEVDTLRTAKGALPEQLAAVRTRIDSKQPSPSQEMSVTQRRGTVRD